MRRAGIVTVAFSGDFGKPRPAVIVESDYLNDTHATILLCPFTSELADAPLIRVPVTSSHENGLRSQSQIMVDKAAPVRREKIGARIGVLDPENLVRLNRSLAVVFGLVTRAPKNRRTKSPFHKSPFTLGNRCLESGELR